MVTPQGWHTACGGRVRFKRLEEGRVEQVCMCKAWGERGERIVLKGRGSFESMQAASVCGDKGQRPLEMRASEGIGRSGA